MKPVALLGMVLIAAPLLGQGSGASEPVTLASMQDRYRPVLIFAPSSDSQFHEQIRILEASVAGLRERDVLVVPILVQQEAPHGQDLGAMTPGEQEKARRRFHVSRNEFTVILLGKDGGEKLRSHVPLTFEQLATTIDAMPMRQKEMRERGHR
jgi:hypothetical protein